MTRCTPHPPGLTVALGTGGAIPMALRVDIKGVCGEIMNVMISMSSKTTSHVGKSL